VHASTDGTTTATVRPTTSPSSLDLVGVIVRDNAATTDAAGGSR
jgi:hypothetical protein